MLFNSYTFWFFFALVFVLYRLLPFRGQNHLLLAAGYLFYGCWDYRFLFLLLGTTLVDYVVAIQIRGATTSVRRRSFLAISLCANLGLLGFFKYYNFFSTQMLDLLSHIGVHETLPMLRIILPVGISFYTFQEIAYTVDVYRGEVQPVRNLVDFALYVSFFPQLVAGPIERPGRLIPQVTHPRTVREGDFADGLYLIITGLFRKVVLADNVASIANAVFARNPTDLSGSECLIGIYAFALQIYGDFSGYSAMAQGIAKWLGFDLMTNFAMPYFADSPSDFWRRWHISLSTWLRDYVYIPLGGNRGGEARTYRNLFLTMLIGGLWHGAAWTYVLWGAFHGLILIAFRPFEKRRRDGMPPATPLLPLARWCRIVLTFHLVCFGWLLFRADSLGQAAKMLVRIFTAFHVTHFAIYAACTMAFFALPFFLYEYWLERRKDLLALVRVSWLPRGLVYLYFVLMMQIFPAEVAHAFIYFQF